MRSIIRSLREDSRAKIKKISEDTGLPMSTIHGRMKEIDKIKIKYTTLIGHPDFPIKILFIIKSANKDFLEDELCKHREINNLFRTPGGFIIECNFRDLKEKVMYRNRLESFSPAVIKEHPVIEELAREEFRP
ncbi:MAG: hypothetical protein ACQEP1_01395 [Nanobdellota archaeon]